MKTRFLIAALIAQCASFPVAAAVFPPPTQSQTSVPIVCVDPVTNLVVSCGGGGSGGSATNPTASSSAPTYTPGTQPFSLDLSGNLRTTAVQGTVTPLSQAGGTVTSGNTFQQVLAANSGRTSCLIQNTSGHTAYVYWLGSGTATLLNGLQILAGGNFSCATGAGGVIKTAIQWTTSTTSDPFVVTENQ